MPKTVKIQISLDLGGFLLALTPDDRNEVLLPVIDGGHEVYRQCMVLQGVIAPADPGMYVPVEPLSSMAAYYSPHGWELDYISYDPAAPDRTSAAQLVETIQANPRLAPAAHHALLPFRPTQEDICHALTLLRQGQALMESAGLPAAFVTFISRHGGGTAMQFWCPAPLDVTYACLGFAYVARRALLES